MQQPRKFIVAPNKRMAEAYCFEHNIPRGDAMYVSRPEVVRGRSIHPSQIAYAPGWVEHPNAKEITVALDVCHLAVETNKETT